MKSLDFDANTNVLPVVTAASAFLGELMVLPLYDAKILQCLGAQCDMHLGATRSLIDDIGAAIGLLPFVDQSVVQWIEGHLAYGARARATCTLFA